MSLKLERFRKIFVIASVSEAIQSINSPKLLNKKLPSLQKFFFWVLLYCYQLNNFGGVPERLIGAVLKTVVRASVPWVRIPPPPPFKSRKGLFC